jgi:hypothetical protein
MANNVGSAYLRLIPTLEGGAANIAKLIGGNEAGDIAGKEAGNGFTNGLTGILKKGGAALLAGTAAVGTAVVALGKNVVQSFASYEQAVGGIETMFGNSAGQMMTYANKAYETAGLSATAYMEQATSFSAALLQGLGGDTVKAAEYANKAIVDMSDNANKFGTDIGAIQVAYQGFAKQNYTMLDNLKLGYGGTKEEMARLINDSGVMGDKFKATAKNINDISYDKQIEAVHIIQTKMGIAGTTALEASTTISGSLGMLQGSFANLIAGMGNSKIAAGQLADAVPGVYKEMALLDRTTQLATNVTNSFGLVLDNDHHR